MLVYVYKDIFVEDSGRELLTQLCPDVEFIFETQATDEQRQRAVNEAPCLIGFRIPEEVLDSMQTLTHVIVPFAGIPLDDQKIFEGKNLIILNSHYNDRVVAEHAFAMLLSVAKHLRTYDIQLRKCDWSQRFSRSDSISLEGKTLGIVGYGSIGAWVHKFGEAFGMDVVAIRRNKERFTGDEGLSWYGGWEERKHLFANSDFVVICIPLTNDTIESITKEELSQMKPTSFLINISRGNVIHQTDLYELLTSESIAGAALDVWYAYPSSEDERNYTCPAEHPFWELDNVLMSPHRASMVTNTDELQARDLADTLNELVKGKDRSKVDGRLMY